MSDFLLISICIVISLFTIWILLTTEKRVVKKINRSAFQKGLTVKKIREPNSADCNNPFSKFRISFGIDSNFFGIRGERTYLKIIETDKFKYWVRVETIFFFPVKIKWSKKTSIN